MAEFELLVFPKEYFVNALGNSVDEASEDRTSSITRFINRAYDKVRFKFDIITTPRISENESILDAFHIDSQSGFVLFIVLGPKDPLAKLNRDFNTPASTTEQALMSDIPSDFCDQENLHFDPTNMIVTVVENDYNFEADIQRAIGSCGFITKALESQGDKLALELTAFTSYMKKLAPQVLDYSIENFIKTFKILDYLFEGGSQSYVFNNIVLEACVIRQHKLVEYYTAKCGFSQSDKKDFIVDATGKDFGPFDEDISAKCDFNIAFIHRDIQ